MMLTRTGHARTRTRTKPTRTRTTMPPTSANLAEPNGVTAARQQ